MGRADCRRLGYNAIDLHDNVIVVVVVEADQPRPINNISFVIRAVLRMPALLGYRWKACRGMPLLFSFEYVFANPLHT